MAIVCAQCRSENPEGFAFCGQCGVKLQLEEAKAAKHHLTVLMCDLVDSTPISERLDAEDYAELIQAYQSRVGRIVNDWGGYIAQYLGDGILVYFGYPVAAEDDTQRALSAGLAMIRATERLSHVYLHGMLLQDKGVQLQVRVGIHTGGVVATNIGEGQRADRLAVGQTPNIAARVQGLTQPGQVWMSESAYRSLRGDVSAQSMGAKTLKGIAEPIELFHVDSTVLRTQRHHAGAFIGRDRQVDAVSAALDQPGASICIRGEAGIGKTRLLEEVQIRQADTNQWQVARCSNYHQNVDLYPFRELLNQLAGVREDEPLTARMRALDNWLVQLALDNPAVDIMSRVLSPDGEFSAHSRSEVLQAFVTCLQALSDDTILVLEDMHWADPSSVELVTLLANVGTVRLVVTTRSGSIEMEGFLDVQLDTLANPEMKALVAERFSNQVSDEVVNEIVSRSDGVPFFAEELMRVVDDSLSHDNVDAASALSLVPDSVHSAINARIDGLGDAKDLAQVGSLLGRQFDLDLLSAIVGRERVLDLHVLISSGLLQREAEGDRTQLRFQHALVLDVAHSSLLRTQRVAWHEKIVDTIVTEFPSIAESEPQTLARHYEGAEMFSAALAAYQKAAAELRQRAAYEEAASVYRLALEILERINKDKERDRLESRLLRLLVSSLTAQGGYQSADTRPYLDRITALSDQLDDPVARYGALMAEWGFHTMIGHRAESEYFSEALRPYGDEPHNPIVRANTHYALGSTQLYLGNYVGADQHLSLGIAQLAETEYGQARKDLDQPAFLNFQTKGLVQCLRGELDSCMPLFATALDMARETEASFAEVQTLIHLGFVRREREDDLDTRLAELTRATALCEELKLSQWQLAASRMAEWARLESGEVELLATCVSHYDPGNENTTITLAYEIAHSASTLIRMGEFDKAAAVIARARVLVDTSLGRFALPDVFRVEGLLAANAGDAELATEKFMLGLEKAHEFGGYTQALKLHLSCREKLPERAGEIEPQFQALLQGFVDQDANLARRACGNRQT